MEPVNSGFTTVKKVWSLLSEKEDLMWVSSLSLTTSQLAAAPAGVWHERWRCGAVQYQDMHDIGTCGLWSGLTNLTGIALLRNKLLN